MDDHGRFDDEALRLNMALFGDAADRHVAADALPDGTVVSTVFLVFEHPGGMLYETAVHQDDRWEVLDRYPQRDAAIAGHDQHLARLRESLAAG